MNLRRVSLVAGLVLLPSLAAAQEAAGRTHVVKRGDTLWGIAKSYFGNPFLWPDLYRANTDVVEDPHWIFPGELLRIPDLAALRAPVPDELEPVSPAPVDTTRRVLPPDFADLIARARTMAVRPGEYLGAPYVGPSARPAGAGTLVSAWAPAAVARGALPSTFTLNDRVRITPPTGVTPVVGDRFLVVATGATLAQGVVLEPTAVVEVDRVGEAGEVAAHIAGLFGATRPGMWIVPLDTLTPRPGVFPADVADGATMRVTWIQMQPVLPSIGRYLTLSGNAADGLVTGDLVALYRPGGVLEEVIGVAQVQRVTAQGASALIIGQHDAGIAVGGTARVIARMR
jgi:hypothetical protein